MNVRITGTGSYIPEEKITNEELESHLPTSAQWIEERIGIKTRYVASRSQETSDLATIAAWRAIHSAVIHPQEIDLIIVATATPDMMAPSTATIVQQNLKAIAPAFDMNAVCTGFLYGLSVGAQFIEAGTYETVLVVGVDTFSRVTDWSKRSAVFFGDGAGAVILERSEMPGILQVDLYADGRGKEAFMIRHGHYFEMDNKAVYEIAPMVMSQAISDVLHSTHIFPQDVDHVIPHQPSVHILREMAEKVRIPFEKVHTSMDKYANTSAGSVPIMLDEVNKAGLLKPDEIVVVAAVGAGWTWGAGVMIW